MKYEAIQKSDRHLTSAQMRLHIQQALQMQAARFGKSGMYNSELQGRMLRRVCSLDKEEETFMRQTFDALGLSMRAHDRILKIARTIADMEGSVQIRLAHLAEAAQYRSLDRKMEMKI